MSWKIGNTNALKNKELYERWLKQEWDKAKWSLFASRVLRYWYSREKALLNKRFDKWELWSQLRFKQYQSIIKEDWRVCTDCWKFKTRDKFCISRSASTWHTPNCYDCRNERKRQYRNEHGRAVDRAYKNYKRKLNIGDQIYFNSDIREVLDYKYRKWYTVKSILNWTERRISTSDNHYVRNNSCVRFIKLEYLLKVKTTEELEKEQDLKEEQSVNSELFIK